MTDRTHPESGSTYIIRYALELGLLWIDGSGRDKVREALNALDALEAKLASIGAGGVQALSAAPGMECSSREKLREMRHYLAEAHGFAAMSPRGQENIAYALEILDELENLTPLHSVSKAAPGEPGLSALRAYLADCDDNAITPDVGGAFAWAFAHASVAAPQQEAREPFGYVTTHSKTGQQVFYRYPDPPYLDNASECVTVYTAPQPAPAGQQVASSAVLKAIREANMQLVRTGDDAFMLVPYKVATTEAVTSKAGATTGAASVVTPYAVYAPMPRAAYIEFDGREETAWHTPDQMRDFADRTHALRMEQAAPKVAPGVGNSGFDHKTAADFLSGKTISDEAVRKFVQAARWAHDEKASLSAMLISVRGELASRNAEIALLKRALMEAEAAPQPAPAPLSDDAKDAARYRWLRNESWAGYHSGDGTPKVFTLDGAGNRRVQLAEEAMDAAIDAALARRGEKT